jgi:predicted 3-demethylubiquinone-9 3-methyltransferase (glyoxalase superfamily)
MQKITPFLWFDGRVAEAARFYVSVFKNSRIVGDNGEDGDGMDDSARHARVSLDGQELMLFDGGPHFTLNEAASMFVNCATQDEVDELWEKLSEGGETSRCGWLKDKFGLWWQIIPTALGELLSDPDDEKSDRVRNAMLQMIKIDIEGLQRAYDGR